MILEFGETLVWELPGGVNRSLIGQSEDGFG